MDLNVDEDCVGVFAITLKCNCGTSYFNWFARNE